MGLNYYVKLYQLSETDRAKEINIFLTFYRYLVFTSKHHDGFTNWPSTYTFGWNSKDIGPKRDVIGELKKAFQQRHPDLHFGLYYSLFEWFNPMYLKDKANRFTTRYVSIETID